MIKKVKKLEEKLDLLDEFSTAILTEIKVNHLSKLNLPDLMVLYKNIDTLQEEAIDVMKDIIGLNNIITNDELALIKLFRNMPDFKRKALLAKLKELV